MLKYVLVLALLLGEAFCCPILPNSVAEEITAENYKFGYCPLTGNQIIDAMGRALPNYRIVWFELSNGANMPVAVDESIVGHITPANFEKIMEWVKAGWLWEIYRKKWTPEQIESYKKIYFNLTIARIKE